MKKNTLKETSILARSALFKGISSREIITMMDSAHPLEKNYHADSIVAFAGDAYERLLLILEGVLSTEIVDYRGRVLKLERFRESQSIANGILFATDNSLPVQILAETDVRLLAFSKKAVIAMCRENHIFLENYLRDVGDRIKLLAAKVRFHRFNTIKQKIAVFFLDLSLSQGTNTICLPYSIEKLAEIFGVARPALSRCLAELVAQGLLIRNGRDYIISDRDGLTELVEEISGNS